MFSHLRKYVPTTEKLALVDLTYVARSWFRNRSLPRVDRCDKPGVNPSSICGVCRPWSLLAIEFILEARPARGGQLLGDPSYLTLELAARSCGSAVVYGNALNFRDTLMQDISDGSQLVVN